MLFNPNEYIELFKTYTAAYREDGFRGLIDPTTLANAHQRRAELADLNRNVDDRIAREWEGQEEDVVGTDAGLETERFTARSIARDKEQLYIDLGLLRTYTAGYMVNQPTSPASSAGIYPLWFSSTVQNNELPRGQQAGAPWDNGIGTSTSSEAGYAPTDPRESGGFISVADNIVDQIQNISQNSLVYRSLIGANGSPEAEEEFNSSLYSEATDSSGAELTMSSQGALDSLTDAHIDAGNAMARTPRSTVDDFISSQLNQKLSDSTYGAQVTEGYGILQDVAQDVTNFFGSTGTVDFKAAEESELLGSIRTNYAWLFYAYPVVSAITTEAYNGQLDNNFGLTVESATALFTFHQQTAGFTLFQNLDAYLDRFVELIYRVKIHNAILNYEERLKQQILRGEVTDVVNGMEYTGNVDDAQRVQLLREILQVQENQAITCQEDAQLKRLAEQNFLTDGIEIFSGFNQQRFIDYQTFLPVQGMTDTLINKLVYNPSLSCMEKLTPSEISSLVPQIRIYKVLFNVTENGLVQSHEQEVPFGSHVGKREINSMLLGGTERGDNAGILSFDWTLEGTNPFTAKRYITSKLKLFFQSMSTFIQTISVPVDGPNPVNRPFRYVDLVNINMTETRGLGWNPDYFKLRIEAGWAPASMDVFTGDVECKKRAIEASKVVMYVTANEHEIDINDEGNVTLTIDYTGWQEASYDDGDADILATEETLRLRLARRAAIEEVRQNDPCDTEKIGQIEQQYKAAAEREAYTAWQRILKTMDETGRLFYIPVPSEQLENYYDIQRGTGNVGGLYRELFGERVVRDVEYSLQSTQENDINQSIASVENFSDEDILTNIRNLTWDQSGDYVNVQYFFLGDLIEVVMGLISRSREVVLPDGTTGRSIGKMDKRLRILTGPLTIRHVNSSGDEEYLYNINLADVPISTKFFIEWFLNDVIGQNRRQYSAFQFVQNLINTLVRPALMNHGENLRNIKRQELQFRSNLLSVAPLPAGSEDDSGVGAGGLDPFNEFRNYNRDTRLDVDKAFNDLVLSGELPRRGLVEEGLPGSDPYHYMLLYLANSAALEPRRGSFQPVEASGDDPGDPGDATRGIYHLGIGKTTGILKRVKFSRTEFSIREARIERELLASATGLAVLSNVYSLKISMFGNTLFIPGSILYLDPAGIDPALGSPTAANSPARLLGIGGYQTVYSVTSYIEGGKYETVVDALFESPGSTGALEDIPEEGAGDRCIEGPQTRSLSVGGG